MRQWWQRLLVWLSRGSVVPVEHLHLADAYGAEKESQRAWVADLFAAEERHREYWQEIASRHLVQLHEITGLVTRRPPRRRWLAMARKIARTATR